MSESKYARTYYGYQSGITGFCSLVWHSEANDCDVPAPEGDYVRESDYAKLRAEHARLRDAIKRHRLDVWGDHEVGHPADCELYAGLQEAKQ